jgi:hypothetical protein
MSDYPTRYKPKARHHSSGRVVSDPPPQHLLTKWSAALAEPFVGVTEDGHKVEGLFPIRRTGVSTEPVRRAVQAYLDGLTPEQRAAGTFAIDSEREWRSWSNYSVRVLRHGLMMEQMTPAQRELAQGVLKATLSAAGYVTARDVMRLNETIAEICSNHDAFGELLYWMSVFGTPSETEPWGWQIDGHHLAVNCFVLGDQLVMTPCFMGSEPVYADSGKYQGTRVFRQEEALGLELMRSLSADQRRAAIIADEIPFDTFASCFTDNYRQQRKGVRFADMDATQQANLRKLVALYIGRMRDDHAKVKLSEVEAHLADTWFGWIGGCSDDDTFYYQVYSPVVLIEFDHQPGLALEGDKPTKDHIHTVVRTPNGNDYGRDLLKEHYESAPHSHGHRKR